jgi:hypothetical protein
VTIPEIEHYGITILCIMLATGGSASTVTPERARIGTE